MHIDHVVFERLAEALLPLAELIRQSGEKVSRQKLCVEAIYELRPGFPWFFVGDEPLKSPSLKQFRHRSGNDV